MTHGLSTMARYIYYSGHRVLMNKEVEYARDQVRIGDLFEHHGVRHKVVGISQLADTGFNRWDRKAKRFAVRTTLDI